jgi:acyl-CoA synthetase (NDP forming)
LAGPDELYDGVFRQSGVIRAHTVEELFDFAWVLGSCPRPEGNQVAIQTNSGGPGAACADACGRVGLILAPFSPRTKERLAPFLPATGSLNNPVDITYAKNQLDYFLNVPGILLEAEEIHGLLIYFLIPKMFTETALMSQGMTLEQAQEKGRLLIEEHSAAMVKGLQQKGKPIIGYSFCDRSDIFMQVLQNLGLPVLPSPERAARAMMALVEYNRLCNKITASQVARQAA